MTRFDQLAQMMEAMAHFGQTNTKMYKRLVYLLEREVKFMAKLLDHERKEQEAALRQGRKQTRSMQTGKPVDEMVEQAQEKICEASSSEPQPFVTLPVPLATVPPEERKHE